MVSGSWRSPRFRRLMRQDKWSTFPLPLSLSPPPPHLTTAGGVPLSLETLQGRQREDKGEGMERGRGDRKRLVARKHCYPEYF